MSFAPALKCVNSRKSVHGVEKEQLMAKKTVLVSDLSGAEIADGQGAQLVIKYQDARRGQVVLDVNADEVEDLARKGQRQARRGRRPKTTQG
jgi:hypothetical protein